MRSFWSEPFLWIHISGLAAVPIFLALVCLGLAAGDPILSKAAELFFLAVVGIVPVLWMQLLRPFYIFSILAVSTKPVDLTFQQRCLLCQFKTQGNKIVALIVAAFSLLILWQIYSVAPLAAVITPFPPEWRPVGLLLAGLAFMASNLFSQIPLGVLRVQLTSESELAATEPYPVEQIQKDFTIPGWQVDRILPRVLTEQGATKSD